MPLDVSLMISPFFAQQKPNVIIKQRHAIAINTYPIILCSYLMQRLAPKPNIWQQIKKYKPLSLHGQKKTPVTSC